MILHSPFSISSRLLPALEVGGATIQLEYAGADGGRVRYKWTIDLPGGAEFTGDDLCSGVGGGGLQEGFASLLSFLSACAEGVAHEERTRRESENSDLFPREVGEWARMGADELG